MDSFRPGYGRMSEAAAEMIVTRTPLRISFLGGGTDLRDYYSTDHGAVLSTTIDRYVYVTVKRHGPVFDERIRVNYSASESVHDVEAIRNNIVRECLLLLGIEPPIYVSVVSDLPDSSGLGGSSSFTVGLLHALHHYRGDSISPTQLAEEASHVEIEVLREPIGKQDQYAAALGGLNFLRFCANEDVLAETVHVHDDIRNRLFDHLVMLWTGHQRLSSSVLTEQRERTSEHLAELDAIRALAYEATGLLAESDVDFAAFGALLDEGWQRKRRLASMVSNSDIDAWYAAGRAAGAYGGKVCGAGGGGFLLFIAEPEHHAAIEEALPDLRRVDVGFSASGSTLLLPRRAR